jgi:hypothetical protein
MVARPLRLLKEKSTGKVYTKIGKKKIYFANNVLQSGKVNVINKIVNKIITNEKKKTKSKPYRRTGMFLPQMGKVRGPWLTAYEEYYWKKPFGAPEKKDSVPLQIPQPPPQNIPLPPTAPPPPFNPLANTYAKLPPAPAPSNKPVAKTPLKIENPATKIPLSSALSKKFNTPPNFKANVQSSPLEVKSITPTRTRLDGFKREKIANQSMVANTSVNQSAQPTTAIVNWKLRQTLGDDYSDDDATLYEGDTNPNTPEDTEVKPQQLDMDAENDNNMSANINPNNIYLNMSSNANMSQMNMSQLNNSQADLPYLDMSMALTNPTQYKPMFNPQDFSERVDEAELSMLGTADSLKSPPFKTISEDKESATPLQSQEMKQFNLVNRRQSMPAAQIAPFPIVEKGSFGNQILTRLGLKGKKTPERTKILEDNIKQELSPESQSQLDAARAKLTTRPKLVSISSLPAPNQVAHLITPNPNPSIPPTVSTIQIPPKAIDPVPPQITPAATSITLPPVSTNLPPPAKQSSATAKFVRPPEYVPPPALLQTINNIKNKQQTNVKKEEIKQTVVKKEQNNSPAKSTSIPKPLNTSNVTGRSSARAKAVAPAPPSKLDGPELSISEADPQGEGKPGLAKEGTALYDTELLEILSPYREFQGCVMRDEVNYLLNNMQAQKNPCFGFIFNLSPSDEQGSHWVAVYVDLLKGKQVCFYNSFGEPCPPDIEAELKHFVRGMNLPYMVKFKTNRVVNQISRSNRCGYHCADFLTTMFKGGSFKEATHYNEKTSSTEQDVKQDEHKFRKFGFI